jgi:hypothetical protein
MQVKSEEIAKRTLKLITKKCGVPSSADNEPENGGRSDVLLSRIGSVFCHHYLLCVVSPLLALCCATIICSVLCHHYWLCVVPPLLALCCATITDRQILRYIESI